jgi:hypothetical protein
MVIHVLGEACGVAPRTFAPFGCGMALGASSCGIVNHTGGAVVRAALWSCGTIGSSAERQMVRSFSSTVACTFAT